MQQSSLSQLVQSLGHDGVRYLVVGGLAVNAHGFLRYTADVDLVIELSFQNILRVFGALEKLGYRPMNPVTAHQFADAPTRRRWIDEKGMRVLRFFSSEHPSVFVYVFVDEPFDFAKEYSMALTKELSERDAVRFVRLETLLTMKQAAGRPRAHADIAELKRLFE